MGTSYELKSPAKWARVTEEYQGDDGPAGSDNEYQGATHFYNLRLSVFRASADYNYCTGRQTMPQNHMVLIDNVTDHG